MDRLELNCANDYDDRTTAAVKSVLVELGQTLRSFEGRFAVIGGAVPWLLLGQAEMPHVGTADVDLALHAEALGDGEYARLVDMLRRQGYRQAPELRRFQLARTVPANDGGPSIDVVVDLLMPRDAVIAKNNPPLVSNFAVQRAMRWAGSEESGNSSTNAWSPGNSHSSRAGTRNTFITC